MQIAINNCLQAPSWETLETMIQQASKEPKGQLTRISRIDGGADYRARGEYSLDFTTPHEVVVIKLTVS